MNRQELNHQVASYLLMVVGMNLRSNLEEYCLQAVGYCLQAVDFHHHPVASHLYLAFLGDFDHVPAIRQSHSPKQH
jgi:hypothetical protein